MIILGDLASPNEVISKQISEFFTENKVIFSCDSILLNLEGLISDENELNRNTPILYNHKSVLDAFKGYKNKVAALANNHTLDLPHLLDDTKKILDENQFKSIGAGKKNDLDFQLIEIIEEECQIFIINACWSFLLYHQNNSNKDIGVNTIKEFEIIKLVATLKEKYPKSKILTYFHWSFDLEIIPSPSYRVFAKELIDNGVSIVVGCHSHCVQGGEKYKDGYIIYGLGNFFLPSNFYANGKLKFPSMSDIGLVLKWHVKDNLLENIWINTSENKLKLLKIDIFEASNELEKYSTYAGLSDGEYIKFFKKNRRKKKLNPIFYNYRNSLSNSIKMKFLIFRAKIARIAANLNLINWQN